MGKGGDEKDVGEHEEEGQGGKNVPQGPDTRYEYLCDRVVSTLKVRAEQFERLLSPEKPESKTPIQKFLDNPESMRLLFFLDGKDLAVTDKTTLKYKKKAMYMLKIAAAKLDNNSIKKLTIYGEVGENPLETLAAVSQDVFMPMLTSPANQQGWPDVVAKEVTENLHKFVSNVLVTIGSMKGQTLLPLPPQSTVPTPTAEPSLKDQDKIHILESAVVTWTKQIKNVLKADPDIFLKDPHSYPGPLTELNFWAERAANLNSVHDQLMGEKIQKVVKVLELAVSTYYPAFQRLQNEAELAREEANDNVKFLQPLRKYLDKLNMMDDFQALVDLFKPIFHTLMLIWKHSRFYNNAARFVTLVQQMCNDLIMQACKFVPGSDLIMMEASEAVEKLRLTLRILGAFKNYYFEYRAKSYTETPDNPWKFQNNSLFWRLDAFMERCHDMMDMMATWVQFNKLEKVEIGGTKGKEPWKKLITMDKVLNMDQMEDVRKMYETLMAQMSEYQEEQVKKWCARVENISEAKLDQSLLTKEDDRLCVNFDPLLVRLLRETKYFLLLKGYAGPELAGSGWCRMHVCVLVVVQLDKGMQDLNWPSNSINDYIHEGDEMVQEVDSILSTIKGNVAATQNILKTMEKNVMFDRKEGKTYSFEELKESFSALIQQRHSEIRDAGKEITKLLSSSNRVLKVSKGVPQWRAYVDYFSNIVIEGFSKAITCTIRHLLSQIDPAITSKQEIPPAPLLEVQLELIAPDIVWKPDLGEVPEGMGVRDLVKLWLMSFMEIGGLMKRLDVGEGNYTKELEEDYDVYDSMNQVMEVTLMNERQCEQFKEQFSKFDYLWKKDLNTALQEFCDANGTTLPDGTKEDPVLSKFEEEISVYKSVSAEVSALPSSITINFVKINAKPLRTALTTWASKWVHLFTHHLQEKVVSSIGELYGFMDTSNGTLDLKVLGEVDEEAQEEEAPHKEEGGEGEGEHEDDPDKAAKESEEKRKALYDIMSCMRDVRKRSDRTDQMFEPLKDTVALLHSFGIQMNDNVLQQLENAEFKWKGLKKRMLNRREQLTSLQQFEAIEIRRKSDAFNERVEDFRKFFQRSAPFAVSNFVSGPDAPTEIKLELKLSKDVKTLNKAVRNYEVYRQLEEACKAMLTSLPLVQELHHPAMRERHWQLLMQTTGKAFVMDDKFSLGDLLALELHNYVDACSEIVDRAQKELNIEKQLKKIEENWQALDLVFQPYQDTDIMSLIMDDVITEALETDNLQLQNMSGQKYVQTNSMFLDAVAKWQKNLGTVDSVLSCWQDVQKKWQALESIFIGSADIRVQLPEDSRRFDVVNADYQDYLETKRIAFPRFYFVAPADLLDILSKGSNPQLIMRHLPKNFDSVHNLTFRLDENGEPTKVATHMHSGEGEVVEFDADCVCDGAVETWLQNVVDSMQMALRAEYRRALDAYDELPRTQWIFKFSAQNTIVVTRTFFTQEVNEAFEELEEGNEDAMKAELDRQFAQLGDLIDTINQPLDKLDRKKLITLCTIDVHARDVVQRLIDERVDDSMCFPWQSQLRYFLNEKTQSCQVNICDAEIQYNYEYVGNCGCLCITPLTDRCYITLTQAQRLVLGGAPAGPAGTGKTETVKDLARSLGVQCYVFNCSDQMDYKAMGQIYKGLAQTGAWGCFDEFNRIPVSVLSVCSTQYKTVLDAIRARKERFMFEDVEIILRSTVMAFITMNPGYPGRAELPESLKALFRPVSMVVPDLALICEIMLMAEGFQMSKILARKFVILYKLCEDLLSKSRHYDWKLRAIKTTLYVAGGMKRAAPELSEDKVLLRALRDFNLGKLTADDTSIFLGLMNDLFPKTLEQVPRAVDHVFDAKSKVAAIELGYQPDEMFLLKISQLRELFVVRWTVFLLGPAGCGKSAIWRTLMRTQNALGEKTIYRPINPKAVTRNELYGYLHPATREWKEGLVSVTFRDMANNKINKHQWIVLDGDIDAEWIESMNTVMDDNKMLTLASNERIPLTPTMQINHMVHCSPATVSRGGVIYVNAEDVGWKPVVDSWIEKLEATEYRPLLTTLFSRYVDPTLEFCRRNFKFLVPLPAVNQVQTVCKILEGILPKESVRGAPPPDKKLLEYHFVFACIWAFGGCMLVDKVYDFRTQFSKWWISEWKNVQFPEKGLVYDYYVDEAQCLMVPWEDKVPKFQYIPGDFGSIFVPTVETTRLTYFLDSLINNKHHVMFVGNTGTGKTAIMVNRLKGMDAESHAYYTINMNSFSDAPSLQVILEQPLEKKSGVRYGPSGGRRLVYFVDDMNMPFVDKYDTQSAIELLRQMIARLWVHEVERVFRDRMVNEGDMAKFDEFRYAMTKKYFDDCGGISRIEERPLLYCSFLQSTPEDVPVYCSVPSYDVLKKALDDKLREYNESNAVMNLVLFQQAMEHITRVARIIDLPRGNAMLVGVGGSGKQSLARLASYICNYEVFQISVSSTYGVAEFKENLLSLYRRVGTKGTPITFLMTDNQIVKEMFLVYINDLLSTGYIADLFTPEDKEAFSNAVRNECKSAGPGPQQKRERRGGRLTPHGPGPERKKEAVRENIAHHMAYAHQCVTEASVRFLEAFRRYNYTTPKSYLELISLYKQLLEIKRQELRNAKERLENGVDKIAQASAQVADLQVALKDDLIVVEEKKQQTDKLIVSIGKEKAVVDEAVEASREDEEACSKLQADVQAFQEECARDLEAAEPVIAEAEAALNSLDKASLGELKSFGSPAAEVVAVVSACMVLTAPGGKVPKDVSWAAGKKFMGNVDTFLKSLINFDKDNTPENCVSVVEKEYMSNPGFSPDNIRSKSSAAAGLCGWVINICKYFRIYQVVAPKRAALAEANRKLDNANKKLAGIRARVKELQDKVTALEEGLMKATADKNAAVAQNTRWNSEIKRMESVEGRLVGDVLVAAAFVSYAGPFNMHFRQQLVHEKWLPDLIERAIPMSQGVMPLDLLTDDSTKARWANEGLPTDPLSIENGAIMTNASRWPLMIDPQLQVEYDNKFRLYLQTKLSNPHYKPEIAAQTTLVNFCVTEKGLEDQLLALVVDHERPDLQEQAAHLVRQLNEYNITLQELENSLLLKLANAQGDILEDIELIENLEQTKRTAVDIEEKVKLARQTEINIAKAREVYRPVATRGSLVYFLIDNLNALNRVYHYSMANFVFVLGRGMDMCPGGKDESKVPETERIGQEVDLEKRVELLIESTCYMVFAYVAQGLFERHKLIVATQVNTCMKRGCANPNNVMVEMDCDLTCMYMRRLLLFRALRPDRLTSAMTKFVATMLGEKFVTSQPYDLERSFQDSSAGVPIFVFLSPEGLKANLRRAYNQFNEEILESCAKQAEYRSIIFALCYFHAAMLERKKFGVGNMPGATSGIGWNMNYPFNAGDLLCCGQTANNYLENNVKVPWEDLRYIFGEIMYGGHIVEDWDRRLCNAYLFRFMNEALLEGMEFYPGFIIPPNSLNHKQVLEYLDEQMPPETPLAFGLHPNAEIGFKLREAETFCSSLVQLQPREAGGEGGMSMEEKAKMVLDDLTERLPDQAGVLEDSKPKELFCPMPVILVKAVTADKAEMKDTYQCPVYTTEARFREEVFTAQLKSKNPWIHWTLRSVCLFLDVA
ncbi:hypothetical protein DUNSADRAFT_8976 [Dunaliella salina]|uniref:Dynein heavy chain n=1 Tax=Dunaliella salina TaxID=3046 RepID=A0ABQ7GIF0_DUNSA|nr:hypothetical protein DUNSADRAFT_8976 [Dunaliella salina]|eukprot:KAF5834390.1 hypothetical protein DUNSADRAFT_8976 [Dunaliella salina]